MGPHILGVAAVAIELATGRVHEIGKEGWLRPSYSRSSVGTDACCCALNADIGVVGKTTSSTTG